MQPIITDNQERIVEVCKAHYVSRVFAFGSAVRNDFDPARSDVDLLVDFAVPEGVRYGRNYFALQAELTHLLGRRVDVVIGRTIQNPYLLRHIEKELLYAA